MPVVEAHELESLYAGFARKHGASDAAAAIFARCLLRADLRDHTSQGIGLLPYVHRLIEAGLMSFDRPFEVVSEGPGFGHVDAHREVGQIAGTRAMELAIAKAQANGIGVVSVRNSSDYAMAACYALQALEADCIGISMSTGPLLVAPWGGRDPFFCTNPIAIAVPAAEEDPIVIDMATSSFSMGEVVRAARDGRLLSAMSVVDGDGQSGDDPSSIVLDPMDRESPLAGAILPLGPKGFGWVLLVEVLAGVVSGAWQPPSVGGAESLANARHYGQCFIAMDVGALRPIGDFKRDVDAFIRALRRARPAEGFQAVRIPGHHAAREERRRRREGVPVRDEEWDMVVRLAARLDMSVSDGESASV